MITSGYQGMIYANDDDRGVSLIWRLGPDDRPRVTSDEAMRANVLALLDDVDAWPRDCPPRDLLIPHAFAVAAEECGYRIAEEPMLTWERPAAFYLWDAAREEEHIGTIIATDMLGGRVSWERAQTGRPLIAGEPTMRRSIESELQVCASNFLPFGYRVDIRDPHAFHAAAAHLGYVLTAEPPLVWEDEVIYRENDPRE